MPTSITIDFVAATRPIGSPVTKFGGHPVWLQEPVMPRSRRTGEPMTFIGQVLVPQQLAGDGAMCMAYVFMTGAGFDERAMETWSPAEGETSVVVQRGTSGQASAYPSVLTRWDEVDGARLQIPCEYAVVESTASEAEYLTATELNALADEEAHRTIESWRGNKIGGSPYWLQAEEFPFSESKLLLQLEDGSYPFDFNLGTGIGYVFLDKDCSKAALSWQC